MELELQSLAPDSTRPVPSGEGVCETLRRWIQPALVEAKAELCELSVAPIEVRVGSIGWVDELTLGDLREREGSQWAVQQGLLGALSGEVMWILGERNAASLIREMVGLRPSREPASATEREGLTEVGNVMIGAFIETLAQSLLIPLSAGVPALRIGTYERLLPAQGAGGLLVPVEILGADRHWSAQILLLAGSLSGIFLERHLQLLAQRARSET